ncbi:MAG TPA: NADH-quinone oxidoreductase subunit L [Candidatus Deferrimicrobiaceae bacterium]
MNETNFFLKYAWIIPFLPLSSFFINIFFGKRLPRKGDWVSLLTIFSALVMALGIFNEVIIQGFNPGFKYHFTYPWLTILDRFHINVGIMIDNITAIMLVVVTLVSSLVHLFSVGYMHGDPKYNRYFAYLGIFSFSMLGLVLSESIFFLFIFWELVGLCSYLLIGFWFEKKSASDASKKAFITNRVGDFGFLAGILILFAFTGVFGYDEIFASVAAGKLSGTMLTLAGVALFCGAVGKSAQFPLHVWLPDAMEGPTPVSALIHAATMVAAGVYLIGRMYPIFTPDAFLVIAYTGTVTLFMAATIALAQNDIKKILAYSTVSQLGFMVCGLGVGGYTAGLAHLVTHAGFKACMFLGSGSVIHAVHSQDIFDMGALRKKMPITFATFLIGTLSISGVPFFSGFFSKDMILGDALAFAMLNPQHYALFILPLVTAGMTAFYMFRLVFITFFGEPRDHHKFDHAHESPFNMAFPLVVLALLSFAYPFEHNDWFKKLIVKPQSAVVLPHGSGHGEAAKVEAAPAVAPAGMEHSAATAPEAAGMSAEEKEHAEHVAHVTHLAHGRAMICSLIVAGAGILLAIVVYILGWIDPAKVKAACLPLHTFLANKWYFDELYAMTVIAGTMWLARLMALFDQKIVDGLVNLVARINLWACRFVGRFDNLVVDGAVNGVASATIGGGTVLRRIQTGKIYHYVFVLIGGVVVIFLLKAF